MRPQDAGEIERLDRLLQRPGRWGLDPFWDILIPAEEDPNDQGQAVLSLDVVHEGRHLTWSVLFFNLPELVVGLRDFSEMPRTIVYAREPVSTADFQHLANIAIALHERPRLLAGVIDAYRGRGYLPEPG